MTCSITVLLFAMSSNPAVDGDLKSLLAHDVEKKVWESRQKITSCYLEVDCTEERTYDHGLSKDRFQTNRKIWWDRNRMRVDMVRRETMGGEERYRKVVICRNYDLCGTYLKYEPTSGELHLSLTKRPRPSVFTSDELFDPRTMGMTISLLQHHSEKTRIDAVVGTQRPNPAAVEIVQRNGIDVVRYTRKSFRNVEDEVTINPHQGWSITDIVVTVNDEGQKSVNFSRITPKLFDPDVWFFSEYRSLKIFDSGPVQETVTVRDAWFNKPIPSETFTLEGMGIPIGTYLNNYDTNEVTVHQGHNETVTIKEFAESQPEVEARPAEPLPGRVNVWLIGSCVAFGVAAGYFLLRAIRSAR